MNLDTLGYLTVVAFKLATVLLLIFKIFKDKEAKFKKLTTLRDHIYGLPEVKKIPGEGGVETLIPLDYKIKLE